jgi:hypothetical protein
MTSPDLSWIRAQLRSRIFKVCTLCAIAIAFAVETKPSVSVTRAPTQDYAPGTFPEVYTTDEVNGLINGLRNNELAALRAQINTLSSTLELANKKIDSLQGNIRVLSDANDALTKRLNDTEVRMKEQGQKE